MLLFFLLTGIGGSTHRSLRCSVLRPVTSIINNASGLIFQLSIPDPFLFASYHGKPCSAAVLQLQCVTQQAPNRTTTDGYKTYHFI
ncbi:MAG: hypothetical protein ABIN57_10590 [Chitinophagaceae bacterium]